MRTTWTLLAAALLAACASEKRNGNDGTSADSAAPAAAPAPSASGGSSEDPDHAAKGSGVPAGYVGRTDRANQNIADARYAGTGNRWEITTGPAHIVYAAKDSARGSYTATAAFEQLEAPRHPEAYGIFIGGRNLDQPSQQYTYFVVRGTGEYLVRVRDGAQTRDVLDWRGDADVPKADNAGKASYKLAAQVGADSVRFMINGKPVAAVAKSKIPTDGIAGLRVNHNLHVSAEPVVIEKGRD